MSGGFSGLPGFKPGNIWEAMAGPTLLMRFERRKAKEEADLSAKETASAAAMELIKKKKKSPLGTNRSPTETTGSSGYSILKETLG